MLGTTASMFNAMLTIAGISIQAQDDACLRTRPA